MSFDKDDQLERDGAYDDTWNFCVLDPCTLRNCPVHSPREKK